MPKIIKVGRKPEDIVRRCRCDNCETLFSFKSSEARSMSDRDGLALVIKCPHCKLDQWYSI